MTYVLTEACLVQVASAFNFAVIAGALSILIELEWTLAGCWHVGAHESSRILLELSTLGLNFKLIVAIESCSILAVNTGFGVYISRLLSSLSSFDRISWLRSLFSIECCLVGLKD